MTHVEHVALWAKDIDALSSFYREFFGASVGPRYVNPAKGFSSRFLSFGSGARLEVMASTMLALEASPPGAQRMGLTHLALRVGSEEAVDALAERLRRAGHPIVDGPRRTGDGYYEAVALDPEGNRVEIAA